MGLESAERKTSRYLPSLSGSVCTMLSRGGIHLSVSHHPGTSVAGSESVLGNSGLLRQAWPWAPTCYCAAAAAATVQGHQDPGCQLKPTFSPGFPNFCNIGKALLTGLENGH